MKELKTQPNDADVNEFIESVENNLTRNECYELVNLMQEITGTPARMWGASIVGFGSYSYTTRSGYSASWMQTGFSPRKKNLTIYVMLGFEKYKSIMEKLGKFTTGKSCLYVKSLDDIDRSLLKELLIKSLQDLKETYTDA